MGPPARPADEPADAFSYVLGVLRSAGLKEAAAVLLREAGGKFPDLGVLAAADLGFTDGGAPRSLEPLEASASSHDSSAKQGGLNSAPSLDSPFNPSKTQQHGKEATVSDAALAAASLAATAPWGKGGKEEDEYEAADDCGFRRMRVVDLHQFVEQELLASDDSSSFAISGKVAQQQQQAVKQCTTHPASEGVSPQPSSEPLGIGGGDEAWDNGPVGIKIVDPVVTPRKSVGAHSTDDPKPVLSRVESLSSSFKDFEMERQDDSRCISRSSQPSEPDFASDDGVSFNPPLSSVQQGMALLNIFASLPKGSVATAAAAAAAIAHMDDAYDTDKTEKMVSSGSGDMLPLTSSCSVCSSTPAGSPAASSNDGQAPDRATDCKEVAGGFSFPVTPSHAATVDPKPLTPWPIRSSSTSDRMLDSSSPVMDTDGPSRAKLGRGTAVEAVTEPLRTLVTLTKQQQRTASDSGITCSSSCSGGQVAPEVQLGTWTASRLAGSIAADTYRALEDGDSGEAEATDGADVTASPTAGAAIRGPPGGLLVPEGSLSAGVQLGQGVVAHRISVDEEVDTSPRDHSWAKGPVLMAGLAGDAPFTVLEEQQLNSQQLEEFTRRQGQAATADSGDEDDGEDGGSASLSGQYIQPEPVDWMDGTEEAAGDEQEGSAAGGDADLPEFTVNENGSVVYKYDPHYLARKYEVLTLRVIHRRHRTGFEETKDFPIRMNDLIAGRYQVMDFLGSAAFSRAVQALDIKTNTLACLKIVKNNKDYFDQSLDEIKLLKYINACDPHDEHGVVRLYDYFYYKEHLFLVCELLRANLYEFQKYNKESGEELYFTTARIQKIATSVLRSLAFLHSLDLIHSDLKPENILIKSYSRCEVKVIDLGSSCFSTDQLSSYVQSRSYRAPEVILGLPYDHKVDIWSLGCILAELSSGCVLFQNDSVPTLLARLEGILGHIPAWMIEKGRYSSRFYTRSGQLYERSQGAQQPQSHQSPHSTGGQSSASQSPRGSATGSGLVESYEILVPVKTSLRHRLPDADAGLLSFIALLLNVDPHKRPSAQEALCHPWLQHQYQSLDNMS